VRSKEESPTEQFTAFRKLLEDSFELAGK